MATITALREGLADRMATISGLRVSAYFPDLIKPPIAIVGGPTVDYNDDTQSDHYTFPVHVLIGESSDRAAQATLDSFCASSGATSIRAVIESEATLGGVAQYAMVVRLGHYGIKTVQNVDYFGAVFDVEAVVYR